MELNQIWEDIDLPSGTPNPIFWCRNVASFRKECGLNINEVETLIRILHNMGYNED